MYLISPEFGLLIHNFTPTISLIIFSIVVVFVLLLYKKKNDAIVFSIALLVTTLSVTILKMYFAVERPENALVTLSSYAFPSGHASTGAFLAVALSWLIYKNISLTWLRIMLIGTSIGFGLILGYSRILIDVHTPFQVIAGFITGASITCAVIYISSKNYFSFLGK